MDEISSFRKIQQGMRGQFETVFADPLAPKTVLVIPSLTLDQEILSRIEGHTFYEERMLCMLMLLRMPRTHVVFVSSMPVDPITIDYYLHLLPGITGYHARKRLSLLSCFDASPLSLTEKILERPRLIEKIRKAIPAGHLAHMSCFNVTPFERRLSVLLGIPIYGCDPELLPLGSKSSGRKLFRENGIPLPDGLEDLKTEQEIIQALYTLKVRNPGLRKAILKLNEGFSGEGNAIFPYEGAPEGLDLASWITENLEKRLVIVARDLNTRAYLAKFRQMQGIVEVFLEGQQKASPSAQCRITPLGRVDLVSTHDQELCGAFEQVFTGAHFPASDSYNREIGILGRKIAVALCEKGVLGRFSIDFLSVKEQEDPDWKHYAIEINLRKGGTTHPFLMLQYLTDGRYEEEQGKFLAANGQELCYYSTDNLKNPVYRGFCPGDLIDTAMLNRLHYDATLQQGVVFHLIGALPQFGKLGLVSIGKNRQVSAALYEQVRAVLDRG